MRRVVRVDDECHRVHGCVDMKRRLQLVAPDINARTRDARVPREVGRRNGAARRVVAAGVARDGVQVRSPILIRRIDEIAGADREAGRVQLAVARGVKVRSAVDVAAQIGIVLAHAVRPTVVRIAARVRFVADGVAVDDAVDRPCGAGEDVDAGEPIREVVDDRAVYQFGVVLEGDSPFVLSRLVRGIANAVRNQAVLNDRIARRHDIEADGAVERKLSVRNDATRAKARHHGDIAAADVRVVRISGIAILENAILDRAAVVPDEDIAAVADAVSEFSILNRHVPELRVGMVKHEDARTSGGGIALEDDIYGISRSADDFDGIRDDYARGASRIDVSLQFRGRLRRRECVCAVIDTDRAACRAEGGNRHLQRVVRPPFIVDGAGVVISRRREIGDVVRSGAERAGKGEERDWALHHGWFPF